ncbi:MAG: ORF6N domain-containing protein [Planctomycetes bacterium]|nr:ORF6N domain-containing protein [Planctomycetota bacterium]
MTPPREPNHGGEPVADQTDGTLPIVPVEQVQTRILTIRGQRVILDADLAQLYGVTTSRLNEQVKRNRERFPADFAFRLNWEESDNLKSHFATSSSSWGGRRKLPYAFTEHGAIMAASVLSSPQAVQTSIFVVRAFVQLRQMLVPYKELMARLECLEKTVGTHDRQITAIVAAIRQLMPPPEEPPREPFGFRRVKKN